MYGSTLGSALQTSSVFFMLMGELFFTLPFFALLDVVFYSTVTVRLVGTMQVRINLLST